VANLESKLTVRLDAQGTLAAELAKAKREAIELNREMARNSAPQAARQQAIQQSIRNPPPVETRISPAAPTAPPPPQPTRATAPDPTAPRPGERNPNAVTATPQLQVEPPTVNVPATDPPAVNVAAPPPANVSVQSPTVSVPAAEPPKVNVAAPPSPNVNVQAPAVNVPKIDPPKVTLPQTPQAPAAPPMQPVNLPAAPATPKPQAERPQDAAPQIRMPNVVPPPTPPIGSAGAVTPSPDPNRGNRDTTAQTRYERSLLRSARLIDQFSASLSRVIRTANPAAPPPITERPAPIQPLSNPAAPPLQNRTAGVPMVQTQPIEDALKRLMLAADNASGALNRITPPKPENQPVDAQPTPKESAAGASSQTPTQPTNAPASDAKNEIPQPAPKRNPNPAPGKQADDDGSKGILEKNDALAEQIAHLQKIERFQRSRTGIEQVQRQIALSKQLAAAQRQVDYSRTVAEQGAMSAAAMDVQRRMEGIQKAMLPIEGIAARAFGAGSSSILGFVRLANPFAFDRFTRTLADLGAVIGQGLAPHLDYVTRQVRYLADTFLALDPAVKKNIASFMFWGTAVAGGLFVGSKFLGFAISTGAALLKIIPALRGVALGIRAVTLAMASNPLGIALVGLTLGGGLLASQSGMLDVLANKLGMSFTKSADETEAGTKRIEEAARRSTLSLQEMQKFKVSGELPPAMQKKVDDARRNAEKAGSKPTKIDGLPDLFTRDERIGAMWAGGSSEGAAGTGNPQFMSSSQLRDYIQLQAIQRSTAQGGGMAIPEKQLDAANQQNQQLKQLNDSSQKQTDTLKQISDQLRDPFNAQPQPPQQDPLRNLVTPRPTRRNGGD
jgi:hypothetical protein